MGPGLVPTAGGFRATDTLVPAAISKRPAEGLALATATDDLRIVPTGSGNEAASGTLAGRGAAVVFPSLAPHSDAIVRPIADGVEVLTTLRDPNAPASLTWRLDLLGDERLVATAAGGVQILDPTPQTEPREPPAEAARTEDLAAQAALAVGTPGVSDLEPQVPAGAGQLVAEIAPPLSIDADGRSVPTHLEVLGNEVTMRVDTARAAFPIVARPTVRVRPYRVATVEDVDTVAGGNCKRSLQRRVFESLLGTDLGWVTLRKHFCWDRTRRRVTYASGILEYDTTGAGSVAQWDVDGVTSRKEAYFPWQGYPRGGHLSLGAVRFRQSALGWGIDSETVRTEIRGHYDGSVRKP